VDGTTRYDDEGLSELIRKTVLATPVAYADAKELLCVYPLQALKSTEVRRARNSQALVKAPHRAEAKEVADGTGGKDAAQLKGKARSRESV
jgi:hypothetical protein